MKNYSAILLFTIFSLSHALGAEQVPAINEDELIEFGHNSEQINDKNILDYGAECSIKNEEKRLEFGLKMMEWVKDVTKPITSINSDLKELLNLPGDFCNALLNLQCGADAKCGCGTGSKYGYNLVSVREADSCHLKKNSLCVPQDGVKHALGRTAAASPVGEVKCQAGTSCTFKNDKSTCTIEKVSGQVIQDILASHEKPTMAIVMEHLQKELKNGICTCE